MNHSPSNAFVIQNALFTAKMGKEIGNSLAAHGISFNEFLIIDYLYRAGNKAVQRIELADQLGLSASGITRLIAPMEKIHLVQKVANERDARQSLVTLTETGHQVYNDALLSFTEATESLTALLSDTQKSKNAEILQKIFCRKK